MYATALTFEKLLQVVREVPVVREVLNHFPLPHSPHISSGVSATERRHRTAQRWSAVVTEL